MSGALEGVKVVGFTQVVAMPACCAILADWGADVIKVEPLWGDWQRNFVSFMNTPLLFKYPAGDIQIHFELLNRNKRSVALNLNEAKAREIMLKLLEDADVFVANYSIDVLEKFGLDYPSIKDRFPGLIHCLLTGYGTKGPLRLERGYDYAAAWSHGGPMMMIGEPGSAPPPQRPGLMDMVTGSHMVGGICAALYHKEKTGKGQSLELSLYNVAVWSMGPDMQSALLGYPLPKADRLRAPNPMYNTYQSKDGKWAMLANPTQDYWAPFCLALGKPEWIEDPRYNTMESRVLHCEELIRQLDRIMATCTMEEWEKIFRTHDIIFGVGQTPAEICNDEQAIANDFFTEMEHPVGGKIKYLNSTIKFSETPAKIRKVAPPLGSHTEEVLLEHGYSWDDISAFKEVKAIL